MRAHGAESDLADLAATFGDAHARGPQHVLSSEPTGQRPERPSHV